MIIWKLLIDAIVCINCQRYICILFYETIGCSYQRVAYLWWWLYCENFYPFCNGMSNNIIADLLVVFLLNNWLIDWFLYCYLLWSIAIKTLLDHYSSTYQREKLVITDRNSLQLNIHFIHLRLSISLIDFHLKYSIIFVVYWLYWLKRCLRKVLWRCLVV